VGKFAKPGPLIHPFASDFLALLPPTRVRLGKLFRLPGLEEFLFIPQHRLRAAREAIERI